MPPARSPGLPISTSSAPVRAASRFARGSAISPRRARAHVHSVTLAVCVLDTAALSEGTAGLFVTPATIKAAQAASRKRGVVEGTDLARMFAWMRPNDLVWNYVVNNYLLGNEPPANEILYWNNDTTRLPAQLHADFLDLFSANALVRPRRPRRPRPQDRPVEARHRCVRRRRPRRSHHAVAGRLSHRAARGRPAGDVRAVQRRPHPEPREPAGQQALVVHGRPGARGGRRSLDCAAREAGRHLVAALARVAAYALRSEACRARRARQRAPPPLRRGARHLRRWK